MPKVNDICIRFGKRVREYRRMRELSQEELAQRAGVDRTYIGGIERGERNPALRNIQKIANALEIDIDKLFSGAEK